MEVDSDSSSDSDEDEVCAEQHGAGADGTDEHAQAVDGAALGATSAGSAARAEAARKSDAETEGGSDDEFDDDSEHQRDKDGAEAKAAGDDACDIDQSQKEASSDVEPSLPPSLVALAAQLQPAPQ